MKTKARFLFCLISLLCAMCASAACATPQGTWTINLKAGRLTNFLSYPSSGFSPMVKVSVDYTDALMESTDSVRYEDLFYSNSMPIGCKRKHSLDIKNGTKGTIYVKGTASELDTTTALATANTIKRLCVSLSLKGCPITQIVVSESSFASLLQGLYEQGFYALPKGYSDQAAKALFYLEVVSDSPAKSKSQYVLLGGVTAPCSNQPERTAFYPTL